MAVLEFAEPGAGEFDFGADIKLVAKRIDAAVHALNKHDHSSSMPATFTFEKGKTFPMKIDPMDVEYDGVDLGTLIAEDRAIRQDRRGISRRIRTSNQLAAVSAHWSAQLRAKIAASTAAEVQRDRDRITCDPRDTLDLE